MANRSSNRRNRRTSTKKRQNQKRQKNRRRPSVEKNARQTTQRQTARKTEKNENHKVLTVFLFIAFTIYLIGYIVAYANRPAVPTETVNYGSIDLPTKLNGIIVRDEILYESSIAGQPTYSYSEYDRVAKGQTVCVVRDTGVTSIIEKEIEKIDEDILEAQEKRSEFSIFKEDIENIEKNIGLIVEENINKFIGYNVGNMYDMKGQVENQIDLRNQILITENVSSTGQLTEQRDSYENQLSQNIQTVIAEESGVVSFRVDGFEGILTTENISSVTEEQANMDVDVEYISKNLAVEAGSPLFKIITSNTWRVVSYAENDVAKKWSVGDEINIYATIEDSEVSTTFEIEQMVEGEKTTAIIFVANKNLIDFLDARTMEFSIEEDIYEGFKVPNEAIVEKTFIKIPKEVTTESLDTVGVIKREETGDRFIPIQIYESDDTNYYILQDFIDLKIGDTIVPTNSGVENYVLNEVKVYKGVYVVNSSIATFTVVDILGSNNEYSIVNSKSQYGLKVYDKISSDAKSIENKDAVS